MRYGLLSYNYDYNAEMNIGDYIQSLAAAQFLPKVDVYLNRENLNTYEGEEVKLIMNGWFMHECQNWPPSDLINPHFISFHIAPHAAKNMLTNEGINYLKRNQPIGCRDFYTADLLKSKGIDAYHSSCLTLTLNKPDVRREAAEGNKKVYVVDLFTDYPGYKELFTGNFIDILKKIKHGTVKKILRKKRLLKNLLHKELLQNVEYKSHYFSVRLPPEEWLEKAKQLLSDYAEASLVITSRIHCALPCVAMGVPVIFVNEGIKYDSKERIKDMLPFFNHISWDEKGKIQKKFAFDTKEKISSSTKLKNFETHIAFREKLISGCNRFIKSY